MFKLIQNQIFAGLTTCCPVLVLQNSPQWPLKLRFPKLTGAGQTIALYSVNFALADSTWTGQRLFPSAPSLLHSKSVPVSCWSKVLLCHMCPSCKKASEMPAQRSSLLIVVLLLIMLLICLAVLQRAIQSANQRSRWHFGIVLVCLGSYGSSGLCKIIQGLRLGHEVWCPGPFGDVSSAFWELSFSIHHQSSVRWTWH